MNLAVKRSALRLPVRGLATHSAKDNFSKTLATGPGLDDFIRGEVEDTVILGNTSQYVWNLQNTELLA